LVCARCSDIFLLLCAVILFQFVGANVIAQKKNEDARPRSYQARSQEHRTYVKIENVYFDFIIVHKDYRDNKTVLPSLPLFFLTLSNPVETRNGENMLVEKPCVRQSQIGRQYESGNNAKKLMGLADLLWSGPFVTTLYLY
jgi:hypothetical protein